VAFVKIQFVRSFVNPPALGKWDVYSAAYFATATVVPTLAVRTMVQRMFLGLPVSGGDVIGRTNLLAPGATTARFTAWEWSGGALVNVGNWSDPLLSNNATADPANIALPSQCCIAIGYRADVTGARQRGRSRWWNGPLFMRTDQMFNDGGAKLNSGIVDQYAENARDTIGELATLGWVLQVKSNPLLTAEFNPAVELYVDQVFDVMRTRRGWMAADGQARLSL
jgi:hypothetical protein